MGKVYDLIVIGSGAAGMAAAVTAAGHGLSDFESFNFRRLNLRMCKHSRGKD